MAGLPRYLIKKYGVSKKAWAVFRGGKRTTKKRVGGKMARRRKGGFGGSSGGMGGLFSTKNLVGTLAGAYLAPKVGLNPQLGAAAGSFIYGKKGVVGAAVGYFAAPYIMGLLGGMSGSGTNNNW